MQPYRIDILGERGNVYSFPDKKAMLYSPTKTQIRPKDGECPSSDRDIDLIGESIFITPSLLSDISVFGGSRPLFSDDTMPYLLSLYAGAFLFFKRGLPLSETDIEYNGKNIKIFNADTDSLEVYLPICKQKFTKSEIDVLGIKINVFTGEKCPICLFIPVNDTDFFSLSSLGALSCHRGKPFMPVAFSVGNGRVDIKTSFEHMKIKPSFLYVISSVISFADISFGEYMITYNNNPVNVSFTGDGYKLKIRCSLLANVKCPAGVK